MPSASGRINRAPSSYQINAGRLDSLRHNRATLSVMVKFAALFALTSAVFAAPLELWYRQPANLWVEALPVGNGRLGAMIFGGTAHERIQFNEQTVWAGEPHNYAHPGAYKYLDQIRQLLWDGKQAEAEALAQKEFMS